MANRGLIPWRGEISRMTPRRSREEDTFLSLRSQMDRLFDQFFEGPFGPNTFFAESSFIDENAPRMDISETDEDIHISVELPGLEPEDINISVARNTLTISGEKLAEREEEGQRFHRVERTYGSFQRSIPLPVEVDENKIKASYKRGVLKVNAPKAKPTQEISKRIEIKTV